MYLPSSPLDTEEPYQLQTKPFYFTGALLQLTQLAGVVPALPTLQMKVKPREME